MQLTVIPCRPSSTAKLLVSPTTPALVAVYATIPAVVTIASVEAMLTTRPCPSAARCGTARRTRWAWAVRLTAIVRSQLATKSPSACSLNVGRADPGIVHEDVDAAERRHHVVDEPADLLQVADVAHQPHRGVGAVGVGDLGDHGVDAVAADVDDGDAGALIGEQVRRRPAHPARRAGDQGATPGDRARQRCEPRVHGLIS